MNKKKEEQTFDHDYPAPPPGMARVKFKEPYGKYDLNDEAPIPLEAVMIEEEKGATKQRFIVGQKGPPIDEIKRKEKILDDFPIG